MTSGTVAPESLFGADVIDSAGNKIGTVDGVWVDDATNAVEFVGVKTGWLAGKTNVIPTADAQLGAGSVTVPYSEDQIKDAPGFSTGDELSPAQEDEIYSYYGISRTTATSPTGLPGGDTGQQYQATTGGDLGTVEERDQADIPLSEEQLQVGKRPVEAGRVRLRKVVRTEHQEVPVDLRREEVEIERIPASEAGAPADAFQEAEIDVPVMREEPVVAKEAVVTGGVQVNKQASTETRTVGGEVRKEDVEVDRDIDGDVETTTDSRF